MQDRKVLPQKDKLEKFSKEIESLWIAICPQKIFSRLTEGKKNLVREYISDSKEKITSSLVQGVWDESKINSIREKINKKDGEHYRDYLIRLQKHHKYLEEYLVFLNEFFGLINANVFGRLIDEDLLGKELYDQVNESYLGITKLVNEKITELTTLIDDIESRHTKLNNDLSEADYQGNVLKVRLFYRAEEDRHSKKIAGIPSYGHLTLELCPVGMNPVYISLYPDHTKELLRSADRITNAITSKLNSPNANVYQGRLALLEEDKKNYPHHSLVELPCREVLKFTPALNAAVELCNDTEKPPFQFYANGGDNCSSQVLRILKAAGIERLSSYESNFAGMPTPHEVLAYVGSLQADLHRQELELQISNGEKYTDRQRVQIKFEEASRKIQGLFHTRNLQVLREKVSGKDEMSDTFLSVYKSLLDLSDRARFSEEKEPLNNILDEAKNLLQEFIIYNSDKPEYEESFRILKELYDQFAADFSTKLINEKNAVQINSALIADKGACSKIAKVKEFLNEVSQESGSESSFKKSAQITRAIRSIHAIKHEKNQVTHERNLPILNKYYNDVIKDLNEKQGRINQHLYFDKYAGISDDENNLLNKLNRLLSPEKQQSANIDTFIAEQINSFKETDIPKKPSIWNPLNWSKRWKIDKQLANSQINSILKKNGTGLEFKKEEIKACVDKYQPSLWQFWRYDEFDQYQQMSYRAQLLSVVQSFCEGKLDMIDFSIEIKKIAKLFPQYEKLTLKFSKDIRVMYGKDAREAQPDTKEILSQLYVEELGAVKYVMKKAFSEVKPAQKLGKAYNFFFAPKVSQESPTLHNVYQIRKWTR